MLRRIRREIAAVERLAPANRAGNLYYIKLNTKFGPFYKLGFTKSSSVSERFSYGDSTNHKLIEKVLLFVPLDDGYDTEAQLHRHFSIQKSFGMFSAIPDMPLYRDGQGELYYKDILELDRDYSQLKHFLTWWRVMYQSGKAEYGFGLVAAVVMVLTMVFSLVVLALVLPVSWLIDRLEDSGKSAQQNKRQLKAINDDIRQLIDELKIKNIIQTP